MTIFEKSRDGRRSASLSPCDVGSQGMDIPAKFVRAQNIDLPQIAEVDIVRHYMGLSRRAFGVDTGFYPLGSCTMKYNPKVNEDVAAMPEFAQIHPLQSQHTVQGCLEVMHTCGEYLCKITGMSDITLQPAAGAQGELAGLLMIKAYHEARGDFARNIVIIPDSAHGTNPASAAMAGFKVVTVPSNKSGGVDIDALAKLADDSTAALMLTNPNTVGLFETDISKMKEIIHNAGGMLYYDGANLNAIMGITRPGDMGFDVMHINLHKTFSTPHGGGGPGAGPVACKPHLAAFLPRPIVRHGAQYELDFSGDNTIGKVRSFYGNFLVCLRALTYMMSLGGDGLLASSQNAVLNANYMMHNLKKVYNVPHDGPCMHEFVMSLENIKKEHGVSALDVAKALLDRGMHPPTMYFPLVVHEALMIEPTETESRETLDNAINAFIEIYGVAKTAPDSLHSSPVNTPVGRLDEVLAARTPRLKAED